MACVFQRMPSTSTRPNRPVRPSQSMVWSCRPLGPAARSTRPGAHRDRGRQRRHVFVRLPEIADGRAASGICSVSRRRRVRQNADPGKQVQFNWRITYVPSSSARWDRCTPSWRKTHRNVGRTVNDAGLNSDLPRSVAARCRPHRHSYVRREFCQLNAQSSTTISDVRDPRHLRSRDNVRAHARDDRLSGQVNVGGGRYRSTSLRSHR